MGALQQQHPSACPGEQRRRDQTVVSGSNNDRVTRGHRGATLPPAGVQ
jgi:hypothetical protein